jgi:membrane protein YdbS with pleckstrin-like domain
MSEQSEADRWAGIAAQPDRPATSWVYEGIWGLLTGLFCVPRMAPELPAMGGEAVVSRKPSPGFLRYLKLQFWIGTAIGGIVLLIASMILIAATQNAWVAVGCGIALVLIAIVCGLVYLAIYLRFDTTWYVFSDRSMRLRRGIWTIHESTITFENIQNVKVTQGPLQRFFGIANLVVETAGGGGGQSEPGAGLGMHAGLIEGVAEAAAIRDSIMSHVKTANTAGLGDELTQAIPPRFGWSERQLAVLREIRDIVHQL